MAAKKPVVQEKVKKAKPQIKVKIPKSVSSSPDKVWRRLMITAIREAAHARKYAKPVELKSNSTKVGSGDSSVDAIDSALAEA